ncbi:hypothetical protein WLF18_11810 [Pseudomonas shirazensis]|uniref:Uncharacterized protein n=2 Tax=Pseudomonas TaxID=286 RepID=A0A2S3WJ09_PSEPU|nr:hypothetical protein [Pseudomonas putida]POF90957.1 hypothetical protein BGP80_08685 [Pseudomonas putida]
MKRAELLDYLHLTISNFYRLDSDAALDKHLQLMLEQYRRKPFFFKSLLKYDRLMVVLSLLAFYFHDPMTPLSRVKAFCERRGYLTRNTLESYFSFFLISGYMHVSPHPDDARQRIYRPSKTAIDLATQLISAYLIPAQQLIPDAQPGQRTEPTAFLRQYFSGFAHLLDADVLLDGLLPGAKWIMNRDGGHLPMLSLYLDARGFHSNDGGYKVSSYAELSSRLGVSTMHVARLVKEGESKGYFRTQGTLVEMRPAFAELVRHTMAIYFAVTRVSMELGSYALESEIPQPGAGCLG